MSKLVTVKHPVFWVVVFAGAILPALTLRGAPLVVTTLAVVAFVVVGLVRARRQERGVAG